MRRCNEAAPLVQHSGKSRLHSSRPSVRFSPPFFDFYPLLLLLLITISLYMWKKKRLNKQILFSTLIVCYAFFPSINEWDVFGVTQPPVPRWLMVFGDWFYLITTYRTARPTHKISGRNSVPDSTECRLKIVFTSTLFWLGLFLLLIRLLNQLMTTCCGFYRWVPYTRAPNKCELNCMPKGERFYYRHRRKVIDGTLCDEQEGTDVCVAGQCLVSFIFLFLLIREWLGELRD
jgi:hypothetical protein